MTWKPSSRIPRVALVGRPNVGKSTLFNRLLRQRKAITDPMPGVTRDPVEQLCRLGGALFTLVDTGGFKLEQDDMDALVADRCLREVQRADLIVLVLDVTDVTAEDEAFIERLRPYEDHLLAAANKVDSGDREALVWNLYEYGFADVLGISAAHNANVDRLEELIRDRVLGLTGHGPAAAGSSESVGDEGEGRDGAVAAPDITGDPGEPELLRLVILGKPNAGKSTLTNRLTGGDLSLVSPIPGTTRDTVEGTFSFKGKPFRVVDTAGIRRKKKVVEDVEYYSVNRAFKAIEHADEIILMVDADEGLTEQDKKIAAQVTKRGKGLVIAVNKWDTRKDMANERRAYKDRIRFVFPILEYAPVVMISAEQGTGIKELMNRVLAQWKQINSEVLTSELNEALRDWVEFNPPPMVKGRSVKLFYITQVSSRPVKFVLFINRKKGFPESYHQYIVNNIRKEFQMDLIPLEVRLKERSRR